VTTEFDEFPDWDASTPTPPPPSPEGAKPEQARKAADAPGKRWDAQAESPGTRNDASALRSGRPVDRESILTTSPTSTTVGLDEQKTADFIAALPPLDRAPIPPPGAVAAALVRDEIIWAHVTEQEILLPSGGAVLRSGVAPDDKWGWRPVRVVDPTERTVQILPISTEQLRQVYAPDPSSMWRAVASAPVQRPPTFPVGEGYGFVTRQQALLWAAFAGGGACVLTALAMLVMGR
jgi:hypothetical protein